MQAEALALQLEELNLALFKVTKHNSSGPDAGKRPLLKGWQDKLLPHRGDAALAISKGYNLGIRTGHHGKGLEIVVLDLDCNDIKVAQAIARELKLPPTWMVKTGKQGWHFYYQAPKATIKNSVKQPRERGPWRYIDIRGQGGYVVAPCSIHPETKKRYVWVKGRAPEDLPLADMPQALVQEILRRQGANAGPLPPGPVEQARGVLEGGRNTACTQFIGRALAQGKSAEEALELALEWNNSNEPPLPEAEVRRVAGKVCKMDMQNHPERHKTQERDKFEARDKVEMLKRGKPPKEEPARTKQKRPHPPGVPPFTGLGNALRLAARIKSRMRWVPDYDSWYLFDGARLVADPTLEIERAARTVVEDIKTYAENMEMIDEDVAELAHKHAKRSAGRAGVSEMTSLARSEPGIVLRASEMDRHPMLLNCQNGVLDLRTGKLRPHSIENAMSHLVPVDYNPDAECPLWEKTLLEVFKDPLGNEKASHLVAYFQRVFGYSLTGRVAEDCFWLWYGTGANGKSTVLNTMNRILGSYSVGAQWSTFLKGGQESDKLYEKARWKGSRMVTAAEMSPGQSLDEGFLKALTGRDKVPARPIYGKPFEYDPTFKVHLITNHKPRIKGGDAGIWRRVQLLPFAQNFEGRANPTLELDLLNELPGILAWAVRGTTAYLTRGLCPTQRCKMSAEDYRVIADPCGGFFEVCCERKNGNIELRSDVRLAYEHYCHKEEIDPVPNRGYFNDVIEERGFGLARQSTGQVVKNLELTGEAKGWAEIERQRKAGSQRTFG